MDSKDTSTAWFENLTRAQALDLRERFGSPVYLYDEATMLRAAKAVLAFPAPFGLSVRYAMKAAPNINILRLFARKGLHFDASSLYEVARLDHAEIPLERISLSSQELGEDFPDWVSRGLKINACSLRQLQEFGRSFPGQSVGLRFNPGLGSGGTNRTNVGGPASSFGIWHAYAEEARARAERFHLKIERIHSHIGSGSDPEVWKRAADLTLRLARLFPTVTTVNLGGGYKVARVPGEKATNLDLAGNAVADLLRQFAEETGRQLRLEIEPGTYLVAKAAAILATVHDVVDTGTDGYRFIKLDAGMTEILRPSLYGAQHPIRILPEATDAPQIDYVVVGHCCESGDILTPAPGDPELLQPRTLPRAQPGDICLIGGAGAYCSAMSAKNYNSYPEAAEVLLREENIAQLIRRRQTLPQIIQNEISVV
ncbi:MAG: diaminopimelate decarboxylase [Opitutales bacterium]|nr:diaminopimelate decarboxylase [Opitutales bacterium]